MFVMCQFSARPFSPFSYRIFCSAAVSRPLDRRNFFLAKTGSQLEAMRRYLFAEDIRVEKFSSGIVQSRGRKILLKILPKFSFCTSTSGRIRKDISPVFGSSLKHPDLWSVFLLRYIRVPIYIYIDNCLSPTGPCNCGRLVDSLYGRHARMRMSSQPVRLEQLFQCRLRSLQNSISPSMFAFLVNREY